MDVYYSNSFRRHGQAAPLSPITLSKTFTWEDLDIFLPAVYSGEAGVVMDLCIRIPIEKIEAFLNKWNLNKQNQEKRLSELTDEESERMEQENPTALHFQTDLEWDNDILIRRNRISIGWYPPFSEEEHAPREAAELMEAYHCDPASAWQFVRCMYQWAEYRKDFPDQLKLHFQEDPVSITAGYFTTDKQCIGQEIRLRAPVTQTEYTLTLCRYEAAVLKHDSFFQNTEMTYPAHYRALYYRIFPRLSSEQFLLQDCEKSDQPLPKGAEPSAFAETSGRTPDGPTAVFIAGKSKDPGLLLAMSSLHFDPVIKVNWRAIFRVQRRPDMEICFHV